MCKVKYTVRPSLVSPETHFPGGTSYCLRSIVPYQLLFTTHLSHTKWLIKTFASITSFNSIPKTADGQHSPFLHLVSLY